jgi:hypothetical protein
MSEKMKEFIEIPQQFVREGNQVRFLPRLPDSLSQFLSSLHAAQNHHKKVCIRLSIVSTALS